jgi:signal peptide peptidase SppA
MTMFDLRLLDNTAWLCEPQWMRGAIARLSAMPTCPTARELVVERQRRLEVARNAAVAAVRGVKGKIGVIPIYGLIEQRMSLATEKLGGTSVEEISASLDVLMRDKSVDVIVLDVDSPGGTSYAIEEASDKIFAARAKKRIYSSANSMMASAAYWLGSAASHVSAMPGADIGSVGVYAVHVDESKAIEAEGLTIELVSAGKFKTEYASTGPLTADARDNLQMQVDHTYGKFIAAIKRNRNTTLDDVRKNYGHGRTFNSEQAKDAGMIDAIRTFEDLLGSLMGAGGNSGAGRATTTEMLRLRHDQRKRAMESCK